MSGWDAIDSGHGTRHALDDMRPGREAEQVLALLRATIAQHAAWSVARMVADPSSWPAAVAVEAAVNFWVDLARDAAVAGAEHAGTIAEPVAA